VRSILGLRSLPGAHFVGALTIHVLRRALGRSPSWKLAMRRATLTPEAAQAGEDLDVSE